MKFFFVAIWLRGRPLTLFGPDACNVCPALSRYTSPQDFRILLLPFFCSIIIHFFSPGDELICIIRSYHGRTPLTHTLKVPCSLSGTTMYRKRLRDFLFIIRSMKRDLSISFFFFLKEKIYLSVAWNLRGPRFWKIAHNFHGRGESWIEVKVPINPDREFNLFLSVKKDITCVKAATQFNKTHIYKRDLYGWSSFLLLSPPGPGIRFFFFFFVVLYNPRTSSCHHHFFSLSV